MAYYAHRRSSSITLIIGLRMTNVVCCKLAHSILEN